MAFTPITSIKQDVAGSHREHVVDLTGPASYTTGGEALSASDLRALMPFDTNPAIGDIQALVSETEESGLWLALDRSESKLKVFDFAGEETAAVDLSTRVFRVVIKYAFTHN